jgi:hypothetical protein
MIAKFPMFSKVTLKDKQFFDEFNSQFPPYADWAFGTLMTWWDVFDDLEASQLDGNLIIKSSYLTTGRVPRLTLLGNKNIDETIEKIQEFLGSPLELYSLPKYTIDAIKNPEKYVIVDDPDAAEYIISTEHGTKLEGNKMYQMRRAVQHFEQNMAGHVIEVRGIPLDNIQTKMMLINSLHTWQSEIYRNDNDRLEGAVIDRALMLAEHVGVKALCLFIDKQVEAFVLYKEISADYINLSHIKISYRYPDLFRYTTFVMTSFARDSGRDFINWEQDLGIEGLRAYKHSLRPVDSFRKYNLYVNPQSD